MNATEKYTTSRLLRAITAASEHFGVPLTAISEAITGDGNDHIRHYVARQMRAYDDRGYQAKYSEIGRVLGMKPKSVARVTDPEREARCRSHEAKSNARVVACNRIVRYVCRQFSLEQSDISASGRSAPVVLARRLIVLMCRRHAGASYTEVTRAMGRKTHTTAVAAMQAIESDLADKPDAPILGRPLSGWIAQLDGEIANLLAERKVAG